jgi:hypothetical protein
VTRALRLPDAAERADAAAEFAAHHRVVFPRLLDAQLLNAVLQRAATEGYVPRVHEGIGVEDCLAPGPTTGALELLLNDPAVFRLVEDVTGCSSIGCFDGRVYRMIPGGSHYDSWHTDCGRHRLVALSINLSPAEVCGGVLQLAARGSHEILAEVANTGPGDGLLFRLMPELQHRVTPVFGEVPKIAYAGWFCSQPRYDDLLRARLGRH